MIETNRLQIAPMVLEDCEEVRHLHNQPDIIKWLSDTHLVSQEEQIVWFQALQNSHKSERFTARLKTNAKLVGVFRLDKLDLENMSAEIGLDIDFLHRRQGYAQEIYYMMLKYFFSEVKLNRLSLITLESNLAAISLYEKLGFQREGIHREAFLREGRFLNALQFSLLKSEYEK